MLTGAIGDTGTILPRDAETGQQLFVWSCWPEEPETLPGLLAMIPEIALDSARNEWLCNGRPRTRTGQTECGVRITDENYDKPELLRCPEE